MISLIPKEMSPVRASYHAMRIASLLNRKGRPWSLIICAIGLFLLTGLLICTSLELILVHGSVDEIAQTLSTMAIAIHVSGKIITVLLQQKQIEEILLKLENIRNEISDDTESKEILMKSDILNKQIITLLVSFTTFFPIFTLTVNLSADYITQSEKPHLSFLVYIPWSMKEFWPYVAGQLGAWLFPTTTSLLYTSVSIFNITFTFQISLFTKVLQRRLEKYGADRKSVYDHHRINLLIEEFNKLFSGQFYLEICLTCLQQCGFGYPLIKAAKTGDLVSIDLMYKWMYTIMTPYLVCACGQEISTQMEKLHHSVYMSNWYEKKPKERASLTILMTSTLNPITLNYKKLSAFNFVLLSSVYQGYYSYIALLVNLDS